MCFCMWLYFILKCQNCCTLFFRPDNYVMPSNDIAVPVIDDVCLDLKDGKRFVWSIAISGKNRSCQHEIQHYVSEMRTRSFKAYVHSTCLVIQFFRVFVNMDDCDMFCSCSALIRHWADNPDNFATNLLIGHNHYISWRHNVGKIPKPDINEASSLVL